MLPNADKIPISFKFQFQTALIKLTELRGKKENRLFDMTTYDRILKKQPALSLFDFGHYKSHSC